MLSKLDKNTNKGKKNIILNTSEDSKDLIQVRQSLLLETLEFDSKFKHTQTNSSLLENNHSLISNNSSLDKEIQLDYNELKENKDRDDDNKKEDENEIQDQLLNQCNNSNDYNQSHHHKYLDLTMEKYERYYNICYTKHSIIDINTESNNILNFLMLMNDSFIDSINILKVNAIQLSKGKDSIYNGAHIIFLLSLITIILSVSYFIVNSFVSYIVAFILGGLGYSFYFLNFSNQTKLSSSIIKDPQFDYNIIQNDKHIIRISSFFNERLKVLIKRLLNDEKIINSNYHYLIAKKNDGTLIYQSSFFDSLDQCEIKVTKESNLKENDMKEIIINEYIGDNILRTISFEEKEIENNTYMTKTTIYLKIGALLNKNIPATFVKDTFNLLDNIQELLLRSNF